MMRMQPHRFVKSCVAGALALCIPLSSAVAVAQASAADKAAAQTLFDQGRKLLSQGKYAEACKRLEQSQHIDPGIGTLLYLADCYEKSGRTASAWATFREAASEARAAGESRRAEAGSDRADKLESKLSKLAIKVSPAAQSTPGLQVKRGSETVRPGLYGEPIPVDPGEITVEASAPGYRTWKKQVKVGSPADSVTVTVPPLSKAVAAKSGSAPAAPPPAPAPPSKPPPKAAPRPSPPADTGTGGSTRRTVGLIVGGAGVVGIGIGSFFGIRAFQKNSDARKLCPDNRCTSQDGVTLTNDARNAATISNIAFGAGAAALATGVVLYLTAPSAHSTALRLQPSVGDAGAAMNLEGRF